MTDDRRYKRRLAKPLATTEAIESTPRARSLHSIGGIRGYVPLLGTIDLQVPADPQVLQERIQALRNALQQLNEPLLGLLAPCYLGDDFDVHVLDMAGQAILQHYRRSEVLPATFAKARTLAASRRYAAVEVYASHFRCVREDGTTLRIDTEN